MVQLRTGTTAPCARPRRRTRENGRAPASSARDQRRRRRRRRRFHQSRRRPAAATLPDGAVRGCRDPTRALSAVLDASPRCGLSTAYMNRRPSSSKRSGVRPRRSSCPPRHARLRGRDEAGHFPAARARALRLDLAKKLKGAGDVRAWPRRAGPTTPGAGRFRGRQERVGATVVGSSNWNVRSHRRDVELGARGRARRRVRRRLGAVAPVAVARDPVAAPPAWRASLRFFAAFA